MRVFNLCRICLMEDTKTKKMHPLFDTKNKQCAEIVKKIEECGGIKLKPLDDFPKIICAECIESLNTSYKFRSLCQSSENALLNIIVKSELKIELNESTTRSSPTQSAASELIFPEFISTEEVSFDDITNNINGDGHEFIDEIESISESDDKEFLRIVQKKSKTKKTKNRQTKANKLIKKRGRPPLKDTKSSTQENPLKQLGKRGRKKLTEAPASIICEICGNIYAKRSLLNMHMRRHTAEKPFDCEICGKSFACPSEIARHIRIHTGEKPYVCKYCGRRFADRSTNIKHERTHTNERPFKCKTCGKSFTYSNVLKNHMLTHTGEKPFLCSPCNKTFSRKHQLDQHISTLTHQQTVKNININIDEKSNLHSTEGLLIKTTISTLTQSQTSASLLSTTTSLAT